MPWIWRRRTAEQQTTQQAADEAHALRIDYRQTFASPHGQRALADLLRRTGVMQTTYHPDASAAAFAEGRRRVGLELIEALTADPEAVRRMILAGQTEELFHDA